MDDDLGGRVVHRNPGRTAAPGDLPGWCSENDRGRALPRGHWLRTLRAARSRTGRGRVPDLDDGDGTGRGARINADPGRRLCCPGDGTAFLPAGLPGDHAGPFPVGLAGGTGGIQGVGGGVRRRGDPGGPAGHGRLRGLRPGRGLGDGKRGRGRGGVPRFPHPRGTGPPPGDRGTGP